MANSRPQRTSQKITIVIVELNTKIGKEWDSEIVGKFRPWSHNEWGEKLVQWCTVNYQIVEKTCFQENSKYLCTLRRPAEETTTSMGQYEILGSSFIQ